MRIYANCVDPVQILQIVVSYQGLHSLLTEITWNPKTRNGLIQMIRMHKSTHQKRVNPYMPHGLFYLTVWAGPIPVWGLSDCFCFFYLKKNTEFNANSDCVHPDLWIWVLTIYKGIICIKGLRLSRSRNMVVQHDLERIQIPETEISIKTCALCLHQPSMNLLALWTWTAKTDQSAQIIELIFPTFIVQAKYQ